MALSLEKIKKDFARNKKRSMILAALSVVMTGFVVKAYFEMAPRSATADSAPVTTAAVQENPDTLSAAETDARIRQAKQLWSKLREQRGVPSASAFMFIPGFYNPDPSKVRETASVPMVVAPQPAVAPVSSEENIRAQLEASVRDKARRLVVNSTVVGSGNSKPVAVINGRILGLGDSINGFEIMAIKVREVVFKLEGVTLAVEMANSTNGVEGRGQ